MSCGISDSVDMARTLTLPLRAPPAPLPRADASAVHDLIAGGVAGSAGVVVGHPFDTIKVRVQAAAGTSSSSSAAAASLRSVELAGLMRGVAAPFAMAAFVNASVFACFGGSSRIWDSCARRGDGDPGSRKSSAAKNAVCGGITGIASSFVLCPTELVKCKMQAGSGAYGNSLDAARDIFRSHGVRGLYRGLSATVCRQSPGLAVYFACYDEIKQRLCRIGGGIQSSLAASILAGGIAGSLSWAIVYPVDLVKSRVQILPPTTSRSERSMLSIARSIYRQGGWRLLYRGLGITVLRAFPVNGIIFPTYEVTLSLIKGKHTT